MAGDPVPTRSQSEGIDLFENTESNLYVFGDAGTGKSFLLKLFRDICARRGLSSLTMAMTGMACSLVGGQTVARTFMNAPGTSKRGLFNTVSDVYSAIVSDDGVSEAVPSLLGAGGSQLCWKDLDVIFIEEVSQVDAGMLEFINSFLKRARGQSNAFGGARIVAFGDFCQLAPLPSVTGRLPNVKKYPSTGIAAFKSFAVPGDHPSRVRSAWLEGRFVPCRLVEQMRANGDAMLQRVAAAARNSVHSTSNDKSFGAWDEDVRDALLRRTFNETPREAAHLTHLFYGGQACEEHNYAKSRALSGPVLLSTAVTGVIKFTSLSRGRPFEPGIHPADRPAWWGQHFELGESNTAAMWDTLKGLYPDDPWSGGVYVKAGSRLMITSNVDFAHGLVNGALCTALSKGKRGHDGDEISVRVRTDVSPASEVVLPRVGRYERFQKVGPDSRWRMLDFGETPHPEAVVAKFEWSFLPVRYGWAVTYTKIQGNTLHGGVVCALSPGMPHNMAYTGITRATRLDRVFIIPDRGFTSHTGQTLLQTSIRADKECATFMARLEMESLRIPAQDAEAFVAQLKETAATAATADAPQPASSPDELRAECIICCAKRPAVRLSCNHAPYCADCDARAAAQPGPAAQCCPLCRRRVTSRLAVLLP